MDTSEFLDEALSSSDPGTDSGKSLVFVNCVFGKSRSTTCIIAYLMIKHGWDAAAALQHVRKFRPVVVNSGFLTQLTDLDHKLQWLRSSHKEP